MKRRIVSLITLILCVSTFAVTVPNPPNPPKLVNDNIGLLSSDQVQLLENKLVAFDKKTSIQFAIVILDDLDGQEASEVAPEIIHQWGIGQKDINNGIVFLVVKYNQNALEKLFTQKHGDWFIATGYGMEPYLTDAAVKSIGESIFIPHAKQNEYYEGINATVDEIIGQLGEVGWQQRKELEEKRKAEQAELLRNLGNGFVIFLFFSGVVCFLFWIVFRIRKSIRKAKELKERRNNLIQKFEATKIVYQKYCEFISRDIPMPKWAKEKYERIILTINQFIKKPADQAIKEFSIVVKNDIEWANQLLRTFTNCTSKFEDSIAEIQAVLQENNSYIKNAPEKLTSVQTSYQELLSSLQTYQKGKYKLTSYQLNISDIEKKVSAVQLLASNIGEEKNVCLSCQQISEEISAVESNMKSLISDQKKTETIITNLSKELLSISKVISEAEKVLTELKSQYSKENWDDIAKKMLALPTLLVNCKSLKQDAEGKNSMNVQLFSEAYALAQKAQQHLQNIHTLCQEIHDRKEKILDVQKTYNSLRTKLENTLIQVKSKLAHEDVEVSSKEIYSEANIKLEQVKKLYARGSSSIHWLWLSALLAEASSLASQSSSSAENDIAEAERRRKRLKEEAARKKKQQEEEEASRQRRNNASYYSSPSYSSNNKDSGGGFGGFSGGDSGGGGAGGSW